MVTYSVNRFCPGDLIGSTHGWLIDTDFNDIQFGPRIVDEQMGSSLLVLAVKDRKVLVMSRLGALWVNVDGCLYGIQGTP